MGNVSTNNSGGLTIEEGGECFRQTEDGVLLSKNLVERMIFKGATASLYGSPPEERKLSPLDDVEIEVTRDCCQPANVDVSKTQVKPHPEPCLPPPAPTPLTSASMSASVANDKGCYEKHCRDCLLPEKPVKNVNNNMPLEATVTSLCEDLQEALVQCYQDNPGQTLNCAQLLRDLRKCIYEPMFSGLKTPRNV